MSVEIKESTTLSKEKIRAAISPESMTTAFPFMRLPPELRHYIYRELLSTRFTSSNVPEDYTLPVKFAPAILRANKQVFAEASYVLYHENDFIVLKIATHEELPCSWIHSFQSDFPNLAGLSEKQISRPLLRIAITHFDSSPSCTQPPDKESLSIFTLDSLPYFISRSWWTLFWQSLKRFALTLDNKVPSRHAFMNNRILRSLDQLKGFMQCSISGNVDDEVVRHVTECMTLGPELQDVLFRMREIFSQGEDYFKKQDYDLADLYWNRLRGFWVYGYPCKGCPARYSREDFCELTLPIDLKADLGRRMIGLHCEDYEIFSVSDIELGNVFDREVCSPLSPIFCAGSKILDLPICRRVCAG